MLCLTGTTTGNDIFKATSDAIDAMRLAWDKLCGVATDGAQAGERKGMASMVCDKLRESRDEALNSTVSSRKKPFVQRQTSLEM